MFRQIWHQLCAFFTSNNSGTSEQAASEPRHSAEILKLVQKPNGAGVPSLWAEIRNPGTHDLTFAQLTFFLAYTVHPGGGLMRGGNGIIGLKITLPKAAQLSLPAGQKTMLCFYTAGEPAHIAPPKAKPDAPLSDVLRQDHLRFQAALTATGNLMEVLSVDPEATWLELRAPTWRPRDATAGQILRHKDYKAPSIR